MGEYSMADVIYIDEADGIKRVMNNAKLYVKLLTKFKADTTLSDLSAALVAEDYEKAQVAAHTIKGLAGNLSLLELQKQALEIEGQIKAKAITPGAVDTIVSCHTETLAAVDKVIAKYG
jgi:HPt (histidine-containing phosphotransfer) domain-containing protein